MAFFFTDGELSINGVPIGKVENVEFVKHDIAVSEHKPFPSQFAFETTIQFINAEMLRNIYEPQGAFQAAFHKPLPEWVGRVICIPERRIRQILGR